MTDKQGYIPPAGWAGPDRYGQYQFTLAQPPTMDDKPPTREGFDPYFVAITDRYTRWTYRPIRAAEDAVERAQAKAFAVLEDQIAENTELLAALNREPGTNAHVEWSKAFRGELVRIYTSALAGAKAGVYRCDDCGEEFGGRPYWTGESKDGEPEPMCAECAGPFLCPDFEADATPDHAAVCVGFRHGEGTEVEA